MNINFNIVNAILTGGHGEKSSFEVLDWRIDNIETTSNNYMTQISRLIIRYRSPKEDDSVPKEKFCFVKVPVDGIFSGLPKSLSCYNNEIIMYTKVLSQMYTIDKECFTPRFYYFDDNMTLVLKDLTRSGYKCADRVQKLDIEHCIYALKCVAKFHALSVKLEKTVGLPDQVKCNLYCSAQAAKNLDFLLEQHMPQFIDSVPESLKRKYPNLITYLKNMSIENVINSLNDSSASEFNVLIHGDLTFNNIMFKYDKYGIVRKAKLIDFQITSWNSPAQDLLYFFITSINYEVYRENFSMLMNIYLNTLNKVLDRLECPTFNMRSILNQMDTLYPFALFAVSIFLPHVVRDPNLSTDTKDSTHTSGKSESGNVYKQDHYREIAVKWLEHLAEKGTLRVNEEQHSD
ncbi:uncharacterized protein LOC135848211 [Planococcus citri]|uniref:uncharacterized protein LOC135848211 n=1 Tax=Planococcus citri TaxID=170843 RepID=UPI0031F98D4D